MRHKCAAGRWAVSFDQARFLKCSKNISLAFFSGCVSHELAGIYCIGITRVHGPNPALLLLPLMIITRWGKQDRQCVHTRQRWFVYVCTYTKRLFVAVVRRGRLCAHKRQKLMYMMSTISYNGDRQAPTRAMSFGSLARFTALPVGASQPPTQV